MKQMDPNTKYTEYAFTSSDGLFERLFVPEVRFDDFYAAGYEFLRCLRVWVATDSAWSKSPIFQKGLDDRGACVANTSLIC